MLTANTAAENSSVVYQTRGCSVRLTIMLPRSRYGFARSRVTAVLTISWKIIEAREPLYVPAVNCR